MMLMMVSAGIGARLRIERRLDCIYVTAQPLHHLPDHMIRTNTDATAQQLHRQMTIAEVPCDPHQLALVMCVYLQQRLWLRAYPHHLAIHRQPVAVAQTHGLRQIEQHLPALFGAQQNASAMSAIEIDQHAVELRCRVPGTGRQNRLGAHQNRK
jgi:hypothetical protein